MLRILRHGSPHRRIPRIRRKLLIEQLVLKEFGRIYIFYDESVILSHGKKMKEWKRRRAKTSK
jgi:hypothetical protein